MRWCPKTIRMEIQGETNAYNAWTHCTDITQMFLELLRQINMTALKPKLGSISQNILDVFSQEVESI